MTAPDLLTLKRAIAATDEQTHGLVHELHGLAKDELLVVEGAAP